MPDSAGSIFEVDGYCVCDTPLNGGEAPDCGVREHRKKARAARPAPASAASVPVDDLTCPVKSVEGWRCVKPLYRARNGEAWAHGGGHFFTTEEGARRLATGDYDAYQVLMSLRPATAASAPSQAAP